MRDLLIQPEIKEIVIQNGIRRVVIRDDNWLSYFENQLPLSKTPYLYAGISCDVRFVFHDSSSFNVQNCYIDDKGIAFSFTMDNPAELGFSTRYVPLDNFGEEYSELYNFCTEKDTEKEYQSGKLKIMVIPKKTGAGSHK